MKWTILFLTVLVSIGTLVVVLGSQGVLAENIDPYDDASQYPYGENIGWLNAKPLGDGGPGAEGEVPFGVTTSSPETATLFLQSVCGTPIIDGFLNDGEWDNAASANFPVNIPGGGTVAGGMLVLNDAFNLYIALWANHVDLGNTAYISFDMNGIIDPPDDSILYNPTV